MVHKYVEFHKNWFLTGYGLSSSSRVSRKCAMENPIKKFMHFLYESFAHFPGQCCNTSASKILRETCSILCDWESNRKLILFKIQSECIKISCDLFHVHRASFMLKVIFSLYIFWINTFHVINKFDYYTPVLFLENI